eukprot:531249-Amorphochlora_amoeboformis.AAC.2
MEIPRDSQIRQIPDINSGIPVFEGIREIQRCIYGDSGGALPIISVITANPCRGDLRAQLGGTSL